MIRFNPRALVRRRSLLRVGVPIACCLTVLALSVSMASTAPAGPVGLTAIAGNASVGLAWQPVSGATGYKVYRSATVNGARTLLTTQPTASTGYTDATAANGQAAYYVVTAVAASGESPASNIAGATALARSCSSGNAIVLENCVPGTTAWKTRTRCGEQRRHRGLRDRDERQHRRQRRPQGHATTADNAPFHVEIYRTGYYGGTQRPADLDASRPHRQRGRTACQLDTTHRPASTARTGHGGDDHDHERLAVAASTCCASCATTTATTTTILLVVRDDGGHAGRPLRRPDGDLPGLQQLRRQVALRLQLDRRRRPSRARPAPSRSPSTGPSSRPSTARHDWYTERRRARTSPGSSSRATT